MIGMTSIRAQHLKPGMKVDAEIFLSRYAPRSAEYAASQYELFEVVSVDLEDRYTVAVGFEGYGMFGVPTDFPFEVALDTLDGNE